MNKLGEIDPSEYDPTEAIHSVIIVFKFCGLWPLKYKFRSLYMVYAFFFQLAFTFGFVGFKLLNFYTKTHMNLATVIIFESLAEISLCIRNQEELLFYKKRFGLFSKVLRFYFSCASFACFFSLSAPFFADKPMLAYPAYYPFFDWQHNRTHFWIVYTYQFVGILFVAHTLVLLEAYHIYLMVTIGGQLDILAQRLRGVGSNYLELPESARQEKTLASILDNVKSFEVISGLIDKVESLFDVQFFYQFICSAIIFCVTAFQILRMNISEELVTLSFYISFSATMMNEIFLPCYFGNEVTLKREKLTFAIYSSEWFTLSEKFKKNMIIFLEGLKRIRILKSGKIFTLSLFSFLTNFWKNFDSLGNDGGISNLSC